MEKRRLWFFVLFMSFALIFSGGSMVLAQEDSEDKGEFLLEEVIEIGRLRKAVAARDDGRQLVLQRAELECIIPIAGPGVVRPGGDQVAAFDRGVVDGPLIFLDGFGIVPDTIWKKVLPRFRGTLYHQLGTLC